MADIRVICAIGQRGQLGLKGHMPWEGNPGREYREDVERFFEITRGHVILCGPRTAASFPHWALAERMVVTVDRKSTRLNSSHSGESRMPSSA